MEIDLIEMKIRNLNRRREAIGERYYGKGRKKGRDLTAMERQELQMLAWQVVKLKIQQRERK